MSHVKKTLVLGASDNPSRYSYLAIKKLRAYGHPVVAVGRKDTLVGDVTVHRDKPLFEDVDTITLYMSAQHQREFYDYILSLKPRRIIFNPGAENEELYDLAIAHKIYPQEACTLVMLSSAQY